MSSLVLEEFQKVNKGLKNRPKIDIIKSNKLASITFWKDGLDAK